LNRLSAAHAENQQGVFHACPTDTSCPYCRGGDGFAKQKYFDWSFLHSAYCISLKSRDDRAAAAAAQFHKFGLCRHVMFYRPTRHPKSANRGIWDSHRTVGMHALNRGSYRTLIMEDDVQFIPGLSPNKVREISSALNTLPKKWMIFFLGHWPLWAYFVRPNVLRTGSACAHAYIASLGLLQWLKDHPYSAPNLKKAPRIVGKGIDSAYARLENAYALFPMIAIQSTSKSDNMPLKQKKKKRKFRHLFRRSRHREWMLSKIMRPNEFFIVMLSPLFYTFRDAILRYNR
jgi:hypothetical protein